MTAMMVTINRIVNAEGKENLRFFFSLLGSSVGMGTASMVVSAMMISCLNRGETP